MKVNFLIAAVAACSLAAQGANPALEPRPKIEEDGYDWYARHARIVREQRAMDPEIVFVGDSITHFWAGRGSIGGKEPATIARWTRAFGRYRTLNLGFGWDRICNVLWRMDHGEFEGLRPKLVVVHIGGNNLTRTDRYHGDTPEDVADGILKVVEKVHGRAPSAHVALMGVFPFGRRPGDMHRATIPRVNAILAKAAARYPYVTYIDLTDRFIASDGTYPEELARDAIHPTDKGYDIWLDALRPVLARTVDAVPADAVDAEAFGFDPAAAPAANAAALQKAVDGGRRTVRVTKPGTYGLDRTVYLDSDTTLAFGKGVVLEKRAAYPFVLLNRGAWYGGSNENVTVRGLTLRVNGFEGNPPVDSPAPGLHGHVSFWKVRNVRVEDFACDDLAREQYCLQAVGFDGFTVDGFTIRGGKDGVHLNRGRNFLIRNGRLRTLDDGVALNAGEWPNCTPEIGDVENGVVEDLVDEPGGECNFVRFISGRWQEWRAGMKLRRCDLVMRGKKVYCINPMPAGKQEYVSNVPPPDDHARGVWRSPEGINFQLLQTDGQTGATVRNVTVRNCTVQAARGLGCRWEDCDYARLIHPDVPPADYPVMTFTVENVRSETENPLVYGDASIAAELRNVSAKGQLVHFWGVDAYPSQVDVTVRDCVFGKGDSRKYDFCYGGAGGGRLTFRNVTAERTVEVVRSKRRALSVDLPRGDVQCNVSE